ncbi:MAG: aminoacyl-tRNA hydrolase, partial [Candidatus Omnitrophica bacterium]|nr:aminoacyl-tRNA hydrolase [Candidatus Omnitrophota bacterium]
RKTYFKKNAYEAETAELRLGLEKIILVKPLTFMNLSGQAVKEILRKRRITPDNLLVISDDINLALGKLRLKINGSDGGHKGLRSIIENLGTEEFARLRIGVGRGSFKDVSKHVLSKLNDEESKLLNQAIDQAAEAVLFFVKKGVERAMNRFNQ